MRIDSRSATSCDMDFAAQRRDSREMFVLVDEVVVVVETTPSPAWLHRKITKTSRSHATQKMTQDSILCFSFFLVMRKANG